MRSFADLEGGFSSHSLSVGIIGFFVMMEISPYFSYLSLKYHFTILSSKEWKVMTATLPPLFRTLNAFSRAGEILSSSLLTSILRAWKVLVAGCILPYLYSRGTQPEIMYASSLDVSIFFSFLFSTMVLAIRLEYLSSPYL